MPGTTPIYGLRYQELGDPPDGAGLGQTLAEDLELELDRVDQELADHAGRLSTVESTNTTQAGELAGLDGRVDSLEGRQNVRMDGALNVAVSFAADGTATVSHGLGVVPKGASAAPSSFFGQDWMVAVAAASATTLTLRAASAGSSITSQTRNISWLAFA